MSKLLKRDTNFNKDIVSYVNIKYLSIILHNKIKNIKNVKSNKNILCYLRNYNFWFTF